MFFIAIKHHWLQILSGIGIFLVGFVGSILILGNFVKKNINAPQNNINLEQVIAQNVLPTTETPPQNADSYNVLLLGSGGTGHSGGGLTDSIILVNINPKNKKVLSITIPRDLWITGNYKINAANLNVGYENMRGVIQSVTGLRPNYFVSTNFSGIISLIDSFGGIEVYIPKAFTDNFYPIKGQENNVCGKTEAEIFELKNKFTDFNLEKQFTCRYEVLDFKEGPIKIDGATALKISRSRHGDSDFGRSQRQVAILKGLLKKIISIEGIKNIETTFNTAIRSVKTNADLSTVKDLAHIFGDPGSYEINEVQLTDQNVLTSSRSSAGAYILVPKAGINNFEEIHQLINDHLN